MNDTLTRFSIASPVIPSSSLTFSNLFTIKPDGTVVRGPGFTTEDEMSLRFWQTIEDSYRLFSQGLNKS